MSENFGLKLGLATRFGEVGGSDGGSGGQHSINATSPTASPDRQHGSLPNDGALAIASTTPSAIIVSLANAHLDTGKRDDDESTIGGTQTCAICMTGTKSHLAAPCGHLCACAACASQLKHCPACRAKVTQWMKVHII